MSSLIKTTFDNLKKTNKKALIPFITANFPNRDTFLDILNQMPAHGANIIEIGIPFSEPMADGKVIQKTSQLAIQQGFSLSQCLNDIQAFKKNHPTIPIVCMTYINPLLQYDIQSFTTDAESAGVDGLLIVDVPPEQHHTVFKHKTNLNIIRLITPTTSVDRLDMIQKTASGFIYYVSVKGTTGTQTPDNNTVKQHISTIQSHVKLPTVIGFGISTPSIAKQMAQISDGVVVGSAFLQPFIDSNPNDYQTIAKQQLLFLNSISTEIN